jgi:hypothetical protein
MVTLALLPGTGWLAVVPGVAVCAKTCGASTGAASRPAIVMVFNTSWMRMAGILLLGVRSGDAGAVGGG